MIYFAHTNYRYFRMLGWLFGKKKNDAVVSDAAVEAHAKMPAPVSAPAPENTAPATSSGPQSAEALSVGLSIDPAELDADAAKRLNTVTPKDIA
jgi:hypothetical protein